MSLILFKYALPVVIGYVLSVGISGQVWPFRKPSQLAHRPAWFLGLWAGSAVALTLMLVLNLAYHQPTVTISSLMIPSLSLLATTIIPGFLVYLWYRKQISEEFTLQHRRQHAEEFTQAEIARFHQEKEKENETHLEPVDTFDSTWSESFDDAETIAEEFIVDTPAIEELSETEHPTAEAQSDDVFDAAFESAYARTQQNLMSQRIITGMSDNNETSQNEVPDVAVPDVNESPNVIEEAKQKEQFEEQLLAREEEIRAEMTLAADARLQQQTMDHQQALAETLKTAEQESQLREEVENNLRITRKAMVQLESRTRKLEMEQNDDLIALEQQLDEQIRENSKLEAAVDREKQKAAAMESEMHSSREQLLQARTELRKNTAARAKALASANKAVAFARQAVDARAQSESRLSSIKDRVITQQTTISSLIKALETEKTSNKDELAFLKAQLEQKDGELNSLSKRDAANQPLTTRLVKKVAKPRTVPSA